MRLRSLLVITGLIAGITPLAGAAPGPGTPQERSVDPVVMKGSQFPTWSAGPDPTVHEPQAADDTGGHTQSECYKPGQNPYDPSDNGDHNCYQSSRTPRNPNVGADPATILGYKWNGTSFVQIPLQVDERFGRYLTNNVSGFAFYSGADYQDTYAFDREGFRYTSDASANGEGGSACAARPAPGSTIVNGKATTIDPVKGIDDNDELAFMYSDTGTQAPADAGRPVGIASSYEVAVNDPTNPSVVSYAYIMQAAAGGPTPAFNASNGYVRYQRDANADTFLYSQSSYGNYGVAPKGPYCTANGVRDLSKGAIAQRRPIDTAWIKTQRYHFRYEGRWLMTGLHVSPNDTGLPEQGGNVGPDLIDQWKARAFQQRPGGTTPCCGYEEEVNNWGGSGILMGERSGPVRTIRATWGADSSTNNIRIETFYRDDIRFGDALRVHVIPPFDGIYVQWDYNAGKVTRYYNPIQTAGVAIDGKDDEAFGNSNIHAAQDRVEVQDGDRHVTVPGAGGDPNRCDVGTSKGVCNDIDFADPTFSGPAGTANWEEIAGPYGSLVTRWSTKEHTAGDAYTLTTTPYYRDDSCFDDGTGSSPGPHVRARNVDNGSYGTFVDVDGITKPRVCWTPADGDPNDPIANPAGPRKFWQGDIATHGLHLNLIADSDNAMQTVPIDEIVSEQRMVVLNGERGNVGEQYGRFVEFPLVTTARPLA